MEQPLFILAVLAFNVGLSIWLERNTSLKHVGAAILAIVITAITANLGIIPSSETPTPLYDGIFHYVAPISIFYLLLGVNLKALKKAGKPMIILFLIGAMGTCLGVGIAHWLLGDDLRKLAGPIAGMITGTYIGGSINFNAVAIHYDMVEKGAVYTSIVAIDNIYSALWMVVTLSIPALFNRLLPQKQQIQSSVAYSEQYDQSGMDIFRISLLIVLGAASMWLANLLAEMSNIPSILILTSIAIVLAQFKSIHQLKEANIIGLYLVYLFLAVIGAFCDLNALSGVGDMVTVLLAYLLLVIIIHGGIIMVAGKILGYDWDMVAIASQSNVGGSSSALALAKSLKRDDLLLAAVLIGALGNGIGTYLGFLMASWF